MKRLRKIWKVVIAGNIVLGLLLAVFIAYVNASTDVKLTMVNTNALVPQGGTLTLSVNMTGTDDNNPDPDDKSPIAENIEWTSEKKDMINFVDASSMSGYSDMVTGNSAVIHSNFAGVSRITATYYSKVYNQFGIVTEKTSISSASIQAVVPIAVSVVDNVGDVDIDAKVYQVGDTINITANTYADNPIIVQASAEGVVEIISSDFNHATLRVIGGGAARISVRTADGDGINNLTYAFNIRAKVDFTDGTVNAGGERVITLDKTPYVPFERQLIASNVIMPSQSGVTWEASDTSILSTFNTGEVLGLFAGVTRLRAGLQTIDVGGNRNFLTGSYDDITVVIPYKWLNHIETMNVSDQYQLLTSGKPESLTWTTSNNNILQVDSTGLITAVGSGMATITVSRTLDSNYETNPYDETYTLTMDVRVIDTFGLSATSQEININETFPLRALTTTDDAIVSFSVTNVAELGEEVPIYDIVTTTVSGDGKTLNITGVAAGTVRVVATQNINGLIKTAECLIYVRTPVGTVTLNPSILNIDRGTSGIIQLIFEPASPYNDKVLWTSSNTAVATVTGDSRTATVQGVRGGTTTISVITMDGLKVASCDVYVREPVTGVRLNETTVESTMAIGSFQLAAEVLPAGEGVNRNVTWTSSDDSIITVDANGLVRFVKPGYATIICKTEDGAYIATCNFFVSIPVTSITLDYTELIMSKGQKVRITAEVLPITATNRAVSWTSSNTNILMVDSNGLVEAVGTGNATILCKSLDGGITQMCNVYVKQPATSVVMNTSEITVRKGQEFWLNATVLPENADNKIISWSSSDETLAKVDADGKVTALDAGIVTIIATNVDTGLTGFCVVTITQPVTGITLNSDYQELWVGSKYAIIPYVLPVDAQNKNVTYESSDPSVASVDASGIVTANKGGSCIIIVTTEECQLMATVTIDVKEYVTSITLSETNKLMNIGAKSRLFATVERDSATNQSVIWSSSEPDNVSVDQEGNLIANDYGYSVITATAADGSGVSASCIIQVVEPVTSITIEPEMIKLLVGDSYRLGVVITPADATIHKVTWVSSDETIARVDEDGEVFALKPGKATITAISTDGNEVRGSCSVYVNPVIAISSLRINSSEISMLTGKTRQLSVRITPTNTTESVEWYSTDTSIVVVDNEGRITTVGPGTAEVVAVGGLNNIMATCIVHSMAISQSNIKLEQYDGFDLYVDGAARPISWRTGNPRIATVTARGHVTARMAGTTTITATVDGKTLTCVITVTNIKK